MTNIPENEPIKNEAEGQEEFSTIFSNPQEHKEKSEASSAGKKRIKAIIAAALAVAVLAGGTFAAIFFEDSKSYGVTMRSGKIENGSEEVAQIEMTISVMPDEYGNGMYEALVAKLPADVTEQTWMSNFEPKMAQISEK